MTTPTPNPTVAPTVEQVMAAAATLVDACIRRYIDPRKPLPLGETAYTKLLALVEALAVDAERGRWITEHAVMIDASVPGMLTMVMASTAEGAIKADAVAAIDAALQGNDK
jgi:hypothetical protein